MVDAESGTNQVWHAARWLEGGLIMPYEKFVMDLDLRGGMLHLIAVCDNSLQISTATTNGGE